MNLDDLKKPKLFEQTQNVRNKFLDVLRGEDDRNLPSIAADPEQAAILLNLLRDMDKAELDNAKRESGEDETVLLVHRSIKSLFRHNNSNDIYQLHQSAAVDPNRTLAIDSSLSVDLVPGELDEGLHVLTESIIYGHIDPEDLKE